MVKNIKIIGIVAVSVLVIMSFLILGHSISASTAFREEPPMKLLTKAEKLAMLEITKPILRKERWGYYSTYWGMIIETTKETLMLAVTPDGKARLYQTSFAWRGVPPKDWNLLQD
jgi:hypothetical protein